MEVWLALLSGIFTAGSAYGAVKSSLNGTKLRVERTEIAVKEIGEKLDRYHETTSDLRERVAHLEGSHS